LVENNAEKTLGRRPRRAAFRPDIASRDATDSKAAPKARAFRRRPVSGLVDTQKLFAKAPDGPPSHAPRAQWHPRNRPHRLTVAGAAPALPRFRHAAHRLPVSPAAPNWRGGHLLRRIIPLTGDRRRALPWAAIILDPLQPAQDAQPLSVSRKLYIRTFGCQMNEYDSAKMADVLHAAEGLEPTGRPDDADVILFKLSYWWAS